MSDDRKTDHAAEKCVDISGIACSGDRYFVY